MTSMAACGLNQIPIDPGIVDTSANAWIEEQKPNDKDILGCHARQADLLRGTSP
jgi:hypothetical protein